MILAFNMLVSGVRPPTAPFITKKQTVVFCSPRKICSFADQVADVVYLTSTNHVSQKQRQSSRKRTQVRKTYGGHASATYHHAQRGSLEPLAQQYLRGVRLKTTLQRLGCSSQRAATMLEQLWPGTFFNTKKQPRQNTHHMPS